MNGEKPVPKKWPDIINEVDNMIQATEQNLIMLKAQFKAAQAENNK